MLLQCLEEIHIFTADKRHKNPQSSLKTPPDEHISATCDELGLLKTCWNVLHVKMSHERKAIRSALKILPFMNQVGTGTFLIGFFASFLRTSDEPNVAKLVTSSHCLVV